MAQPSWAELFWIAMGVAVAVPALLAAATTHRAVRPVLLAWFVSPVFAYVAAVAWESLTRSVPDGWAASAFYGLMLISPVLGPPWMAACLLGAGLGAMIRRARRT